MGTAVFRNDHNGRWYALASHLSFSPKIKTSRRVPKPLLSPCDQQGENVLYSRSRRTSQTICQMTMPPGAGLGLGVCLGPVTNSAVFHSPLNTLRGPSKRRHDSQMIFHFAQALRPSFFMYGRCAHILLCSDVDTRASWQTPT